MEGAVTHSPIQEDRSRAFERQDRLVLRDLAGEVAEIAALPAMAERKERWIKYNSLRSTYPMMLVYPEGAWEELLPHSTLQCQDEQARQIEWALRARIYTYRRFQDDTVVEAEWVVPAVVTETGWGLESRLEGDTILSWKPHPSYLAGDSAQGHAHLRASPRALRRLDVHRA
jgi:hypothetical protein